MKNIFFITLIFFQANIFAENCKESIWGPDDEIGNVNLITSESVLNAAKLITKGKTYSLGITIDKDTPAYPPRSLSLQIVQPDHQHGAKPFPNMTANDDIFQGWFGIGSQIDGLGHIGDHDGIFYNCYDGKDFAQITGLTTQSRDRLTNDLGIHRKAWQDGTKNHLNGASGI